MKIEALQNQHIFMLGCTVEGSRLRALLSFTKPKMCAGFAGQEALLVEPYRQNNTEIVVVMPSDLEAIYTYLDLEVVRCDSDLMGN